MLPPQGFLRLCSILVLLKFSIPGAHSFRISLKDGGYEHITVEIDWRVPITNCNSVIQGLQQNLEDASQALYKLLKVYWRSVDVIVPKEWSNHCVHTEPSTGGDANILVSETHLHYKDTPWTQQSKPCGQEGDFIYLSHKALDRSISKSLVAEWVKFRYGVFDEKGYEDDPIYPHSYIPGFHGQEEELNGCSDKPLNNSVLLDPADATHPGARTSLLFTTAHNVDSFCNSSNHNKFAQTKQNNLCDRRSVMEVILSHKDFANRYEFHSHDNLAPKPKFNYKVRGKPRVVLVVDTPPEPSQTLALLKHAVRFWILNQVPDGAELGVVQDNEIQDALTVIGPRTRDIIGNGITFSRQKCVKCDIELAQKMLRDAEGPANSVIIVVASDASETESLIEGLNQDAIRVVVINYPSRDRDESLQNLATGTNGIVISVAESLNETSHTYFDLLNAFLGAQQFFHKGSNLIEIYRKKLETYNVTKVDGFFVDDNIESGSFLAIYAEENDLKIKLTNPVHTSYSRILDVNAARKVLNLHANVNRPGSWSYSISKQQTNQSVFVQVLVKPKPETDQITGRFYTFHSGNSLILYCDVKKGLYPISKANVEVTVLKMANGEKHKVNDKPLLLLDSGSGDPDLMRGDGIYSSYYALPSSGTYIFEVSIDFSSAYTWSNADTLQGAPCCGSFLKDVRKTPMEKFGKKTLNPVSLYLEATSISMGRILDLKASPARGMNVVLTWTSPVHGSEYNIRFDTSLETILNSFNSTRRWPQSTSDLIQYNKGDEISFTLDFGRAPDLLGKNLYFAVRIFNNDSRVPPPRESNWVRIFVPIPPTEPPTTTPLPFTPSWPYSEESSGPDFPANILLSTNVVIAVVVGLAILIIAVTLYCYLCLRKKTKKEPKSKEKLNVTIVHENGGTSPPPMINNTLSVVSTDGIKYTVGPPSCDDTKSYTYTGYDVEAGLNTYSNGPLEPIAEYDREYERDKTLSPYESWSASQLLHEHERRHSPYGDFRQVFPPPVPPLPIYQQEYLVSPPQQTHLPPPSQFLNYPPGIHHLNPNLFTTSLQGSMTSINSSGKIRNVTMV